MKRKIIIPLAISALFSAGALVNVASAPGKDAIVAKAEGVKVLEVSTFAHLETNGSTLTSGFVQMYTGISSTGRADDYATWEVGYTGGSIKVDNEEVSGVIKIVGGLDVFVDLGGLDVSNNSQIKLNGTFTADNGNTFVANNLICFLKHNTIEVTGCLKPFLHEASNPDTGTMYLMGNGISESVPVSWDMPYVSTGGKVKLDGQEISSFTLKRVADGGNGFYLQSDELIGKSGMVTLEGTFGLADANANFKSNCSIYLQNTQIPFNYNYGTISGISQVDAVVSTNIAGGQVYILADKPNGLISTWDCQFNGLTIKINGTDVSSAITVLNVEGNRFFLEGEPIKALKKGDTITIDGEGYASIKGWPNAKAFYKVSFSNYSAVFGGVVSGEVNVASVDKNFVYLNVAGLDSMPEPDWEKPYTGGSVKLNGEAVAGVSIKYIPGNQIFVELPTDKAYAVGTWTLDGVFKNGDDAIALKNIQFNFVKENIGELRKTRDDAASKSWMYLSSNTENNIPSDGNWTKRLFPLGADALKLTRNGVTTDVAVAGTFNQPDGPATEMVKTGAATYALELSTVTGGAQVGDIITIGGTWAMNSGSTFYMSDVAEQKFMLTENNWIKIVETSIRNADVNWNDAYLKLYYPEALGVYDSYNPSGSGDKNTWSSALKITGLYDKIILNGKQTLTEIVRPCSPTQYNANICEDGALKLIDLLEGYIGKNPPTTITIKAGALLPTDSESFQVMSPVGVFAITTEDVTFSWNGNKYIKAEYSPAHYTEIGYLTYVGGQDGKYIGFAEAFDGMNTGWDASYAPLGSDSYLKYNGNNYYSLISTGSACFYFEQMPTPKAGDVIEVNGQFVSRLDNTVITINHSKFEYTDKGWVIVYDVARKQFELEPEFDAYRADEIALLEEDFMTACEEALLAGKNALGSAETVAACDAALAEYKDAVDAQIAENALYLIKQDAISEVSEYQAATINSMKDADKSYCVGLRDAALQDIQDATSETEIAGLVTAYKAAIDAKINAVALEAAKAAAVAEIEAYKADEIAALGDSDKSVCTVIMNNAKSAISEATSVQLVNDAVASYKSNIDAKLAEVAFEAYKAEQILGIEGYRANDIAALQDSAKTAIATKLDAAKTAIGSAENKAAVDLVVSDFEDEVDAIISFENYKKLTAEQLTFDSTLYEDAEIEQINAKKAEISASIMAQTTEAGVQAEVAKFEDYLETVKTKADYEKELDDAKNALSREIDEYFATIDADKYEVADYATLEGYYEEAQTAVENATKLADLEDILENFKAQVATVSEKQAGGGEEEQPEEKKGCGGSVVAASAVVTGLALAGVTLVLKKKEE